MKYKFEVEKRDYSDFASGRVLYSAPSTTGFPVRLASEIMQRAFAILAQQGVDGPLRIYNPCCGGAFLLTTIGFLFPRQVGHLIATDLDPLVLEIAEKNLSLLSPRDWRGGGGSWKATPRPSARTPTGPPWKAWSACGTVWAEEASPFPVGSGISPTSAPFRSRM